MRFAEFSSQTRDDKCLCAIIIRSDVDVRHYILLMYLFFLFVTSNAYTLMPELLNSSPKVYHMLEPRLKL